MFDEGCTEPQEGNGSQPAAKDERPKPSDEDVPRPAETTSSGKPASQPSEKPAPVIIVPGDGTITIASQDREALDQIEALLSALSRETTGLGRNFVVFSLRNTSAAQVADTLDQLFRAIGADWRGGVGKVVAVADERLNAILVYANRSDQKIVEALIRVLDTSEIPDSMAIIRPRLIPIKNTRATDIETLLRDVYKTQLSMGGARKQLNIPRGVPGEVASVLRQLNVASSGPLLTLAVDELTNTLIVMGPVDLVEEISEVVEELDQAALQENPTRSLRIVSLKKLNSSRLNEALQMFLQRRGRGASPGRRPSRPRGN
jgi:type II secretory pathway component GspD/PulD (secretin)